MFVHSQLHGGVIGGGTLEYDIFTIFEKAQVIPAPLPPSAALTAAAVQLFGVIFPHLAIQQRYNVPTIPRFIEFLYKAVQGNGNA